MSLSHLLYQTHPLTQQEAFEVFQHLVSGKLSDIQISSLLTALKVRGETPDEIAGAALALREAAEPFPRPTDLIADSCGTGGDNSNTINISTAAALVCASMGLKITKHGNRSVSSRSGSADVLEQLGVPLNSASATDKHLLETHRFCFLFAPQFHPGIRYAMPVRKALKTRTIFNLLGPLVNPAHPDIQLLGVYAPELCLPLAQTLQRLECQRAMVVHGGGLDEIAIHDSTLVAELHEGQIHQYTLHPSDFGLPVSPLEALQGGDADTNAKLIQDVFAGRGIEAHQHAIAINAAALLKLSGFFTNFKEATEAVLEHIKQGKTLAHLEAMKNTYNFIVC